MIGYRQAHRRVEQKRGPAKQHSCECGQPARQWAYQGRDPLGYSLDADDYLPMCRSCHMKLDLGIGTPHAEHLAQISNSGNAALALKFQDPEYSKNRKEKSSMAGKIGGPMGSRIRRTCAECGLAANPGNLSQHQTFKGHTGVLDG